jgi:hypothetical protein
MVSANKKTVVGLGKMIWMCLAVLLFSPASWAQGPPVVQQAKSDIGGSLGTEFSDSEPQRSQSQTGSISGKIVDQSGANISGAVVKLTYEGESAGLEVASGEDGQFVFSNVAPGPFKITVTSADLASQDFSATMHSGEAFVTPVITLVIPSQEINVRVELSPNELADVQIKQQEKQRVLGFVPNFYVSYVPEAAPLTAKNKFELAWKSATDPVTFAGVAFLAGIDQAGDRWAAYGQGAQGYGKRFGAAYANVFDATFIGGALLPSLLKQDPRYFYKGTGSKRSKFFYAIASSFICKGDNGRWQPNYSDVLGSFAAAGIAKLYYPAKDSRGAGFVVSAAMIRLGETSLAGVLQEFVFPKLTPNRPNRSAH